MRYILTFLILVGLSCNEPNRKDNKSITLNGEKINDSTKSSITEEVFSNYEEEPVFVRSNEMPEIGEGKACLKKFFKERLTYPQSAIEDSIEGRVFLTFVIETDGRVSNVRVIRGVRDDLDSECIRVAKLMPKWAVPAKQNGKPVRIGYSTPITFSLHRISKENFVNVYPNLKLALEIKLKMYPNPTRDFVTIESNGLNDLEYVLISLNGQIIKSGKILTDKEQISVSDLTNGIYVMKFISKEMKFSKTEKLIKQ